MRRRQFLKSALLALAAAPALVRRGFADASVPDKGAVDADGKVDALAKTLARARDGKRSVLVLVIPRDEAAKWERGMAYGELINHGAVEDVAPLALVDVVAATMDSVRAQVAEAPDGDPLFVLVDTATGRARGADAKLPTFRELDHPRADWNKRLAAEEHIVDARLRLTGRLVRELVGAVPPERAATLAAEARAKLAKRRVPGSWWAVASGCGTQVEDDEDPGLMPACGMGHVPERSRRFVYLYSETPGQARKRWEREHKKKGTSL